MDKELHEIKNKLQLISNNCFKKATLFQGIELYFLQLKLLPFPYNIRNLNILWKSTIAVQDVLAGK